MGHFDQRNQESKACQWLASAGAVSSVTHGLINSPAKEGTMTTRGYQYMEKVDRSGGKVKPQKPRILTDLREGL